MRRRSWPSDHRGYHRESRRFHLALLAPARSRRLMRMLESAWNLTEPVRPMAQIPDTDRAALHEEHRDMLDAFVARDAERLLAVSAQHHRHLEDSIAALPQDSSMLAWSGPPDESGVGARLCRSHLDDLGRSGPLSAAVVVRR